MGYIGYVKYAVNKDLCEVKHNDDWGIISSTPILKLFCY